MLRLALHGRAIATALGLLAGALVPAGAQPQPGGAPPAATPAPSGAAAAAPRLPVANDSKHLGVANCAGSTCHGRSPNEPPVRGATVHQNEYLIWSQETDPHKIDKHHQAYAALTSDRGKEIARKLKLPDAATADVCLNCHADNPPKDKRGPLFDLANGVGCEACHGGSASWLGVHLSGAGHKANLEAGLYPTDQPLARAALCLSCHLGDEKKPITHEIMGAGHPRLPFELATFTVDEPAHFVVDKSYVQRKGPVNNVQVWAVGQASDLVMRMNQILDPKNAPKGIQPELIMFDCDACHHAISQVRWQPRPETGLGPGTIPLYDANAVMLRVIAARAAPAAAKALADHMLALHRSTIEGSGPESWEATKREATQVRAAATELIPALAGRDFNKDDIKALADGVMGVVLTGQGLEYSVAEQVTRALRALAMSMQQLGFANPDQVKAMGDAMGAVDKAIANDETYKPDVFVAALRDFQKTVPQ